MSNEREEEQEKPRIQVVDNRMLNDDERAGKISTQQNPNEMPEIPGEDLQEIDETDGEDSLYPDEIGEPNDEEVEPLSAEEMAQMQSEIEAAELEQFSVIEARMGRPLTEQEKNSVRDEMGRQAEAVASLQVEPMLQQFIVQMSQVAAVHMGLTANPYTRLMARNDAQARLAIDSFSALLDVIRPLMDSSGAREYDRVLNDLRVNYVQITGKPMDGGGSVFSGLAGIGGNKSGGRIIH